MVHWWMKEKLFSYIKINQNVATFFSSKMTSLFHRHLHAGYCLATVLANYKFHPTFVLIEYSVSFENTYFNIK